MCSLISRATPTPTLTPTLTTTPTPTQEALKNTFTWTPGEEERKPELPETPGRGQGPSDGGADDAGGGSANTDPPIVTWMKGIQKSIDDHNKRQKKNKELKER